MYRPLFLLFIAIVSRVLHAEDGYRLWLRYDRIADESLHQLYVDHTRRIIFTTPTGTDSPTLDAAREELIAGLRGLLDVAPPIEVKKVSATDALGDEGYQLRAFDHQIEIAANHDVGVLY